jgi:hypothetical protein
LWATIQNNSLKEYAYLLESNNLPVNIEAGMDGSFWNLAHFCIRWDAYDCLNYAIKRTYAKKYALQLSLMNQQTIEGYTAIMMAIVWNAPKCFHLLINYGGVDLSYKDKANNDPFALCIQYKRN